MTDNDLNNRELSIEELEAIAAGNWLGDAIRWVGHEVSVGLHYVAPVISWIEKNIKWPQPWKPGPGKL